LQNTVGCATEEEFPRTRKLTEREQQVLAGVHERLANKQIAEHLQVPESSVKATLQQRLQRTGVRIRSQLVGIALDNIAS
jgi:DNA-binding NarL/FixJ family response regulator